MEYDLGAEMWQLMLPGRKVADPTLDGIRKQAERELREEVGYRPGRLLEFRLISDETAWEAAQSIAL